MDGHFSVIPGKDSTIKNLERVNGSGIGKNTLHCLTFMTKHTHCFVSVNEILKSIRTEVEGCCCVPVPLCWISVSHF